MSESTKPNEEGRISRLNLVRAGSATGMSLKMPKRGRVVVDLDDIIPDPRNERKAFRGIDELAASIKRVGIVEPPTVVPMDDGKYMLTTGERRWRASKKAGLKQIPVIVGDPEEERSRRIKSLASNVQREDLSAMELSQALQDMKDDNPEVKTNRDLAGMVGKSEQWVGQMLKILTLPEEIQKKVRSADRVLSYDSVVELARLEKPEAQAELLKSLLSGATVREVRQKARETKPSSKKGAGKGKTASTHKIKLSSGGWVIIHSTKKSPKKDDYLEALTEALKALKQADI